MEKFEQLYNRILKFNDDSNVFNLIYLPYGIELYRKEDNTLTFVIY